MGVSKILNVKDNGVTLGVLDKDLRAEPDLIEVTYADLNGVPHTVYAHRDGPFDSPEAVAQAHDDGTLHAAQDHPAPDATETATTTPEA